jgi:SAM-dependent methyltransferase
MPSLDDRKAREKRLQDQRFAAADGTHGGTGGAYAIVGASHGYCRRRLVVDAPGKRVLEIGCGLGDNVLELAAAGAHATGVDLSEVAVENARSRAKELGVDARFLAMDAEAMTFPNRAFDIVCGGAILHHLDTERAYRQISRLLDVHGYAIFVEPLGHNPLINLYRRFTPSLRTPDEHPLLERDLRLAERHFADVRVTYYYLTTLLMLPIARTRLGRVWTDAANRVDRALFRFFPGLRKQAWCVVLELRQPRQ